MNKIQISNAVDFVYALDMWDYEWDSLLLQEVFKGIPNEAIDEELIVLKGGHHCYFPKGKAITMELPLLYTEGGAILFTLVSFPNLFLLQSA